MKFDLDLTDYTIILNALHYYKKVEKRGNFDNYEDKEINSVRDRMAEQMTKQAWDYLDESRTL